MMGTFFLAPQQCALIINVGVKHHVSANMAVAKICASSPSTATLGASAPRKFECSFPKPVVGAQNRRELERRSRKFGFPTSLDIQPLRLDYRPINAELRLVQIRHDGWICAERSVNDLPEWM
ncbi:hypothetical protein AVEN_105250-1, partial [Araneus ventricosus]